jgi:gluconolactonase
VLADNYYGEELNSPNDVIVRSDGLIYFTDPVFGRNDEPAGAPRPYPTQRRPVYMLDERKNALTIAADNFANPNGLCFSPDEKILYVNDSPIYCIYMFDVSANGELANRRLFAKTEGERDVMPDGMKIDEFGNVICAAQDGLYYFQPDGHLLGILLTEDPAMNFTWGSADGYTLFITCRHFLSSVRIRARGYLNVKRGIDAGRQ